MSQKNGLFGLIVGITAGVAAATAGSLAALKVVNEIKNDSHETTMVSPNEKNYVTVTYGSSDFARGLTLVKVKAESEGNNCDISFLASKDAKMSFNWKDDENFELGITDVKHEKICSVSFEGNEINMKVNSKKD